ncbi:MAG TPA: sugar phosphate nucleotidyltransferase, partial [Thermomicrobiales bacterium]|nr:sugar phosphate nucleotidyltransferase [Thermomicrobiales bacterium]
ARANLPIPTEFVVQPQMLGQTDAIIRCRDIATGSGLVLFPDAVFDADFTHLAERDADVVVFTKIVEDPSQLGVVVIEEGRVVRLVEKPQEPISNQAVIGIYYFKSMPALYAAIDKQMAQQIKTKGEYFIADAIQLMINDGAVVHAQPIDFWEDCGNTEALLSTNRILLDRLPENSDRVGDSLVIHPSSIGANVTLVRSIVGPHASIGDGVSVTDSIIADSIVEAGATITTANLRHSIIGSKASVTGHGESVSISDASQVIV